MTPSIRWWKNSSRCLKCSLCCNSWFKSLSDSCSKMVWSSTDGLWRVRLVAKSVFFSSTTMVQGQLGKTNSKHFQILSKLALTQQSCREDQVDGSVCGASNSKMLHMEWPPIGDHKTKCADALSCRSIIDMITEIWELVNRFTALCPNRVFTALLSDQTCIQSYKQATQLSVLWKHDSMAF